MRVFLAGATGVMGRALVPRLVAAGHEVTGTTRSPAKAGLLRAAGAEPAVLDAFDAPAVRAVVAAAEPEVVVHELTDLPASLNLRRYAQQMEGNDRLRREATPILVDAAVAAGARRVVAQSVAFVYDPSGPALKDEDQPVMHDPPATVRPSAEAIAALERAVLETPGIEGVVLRYGFFYGPGTTYAPDGATAKQVRRRQFPIVGAGDGVFSFVHTEDAAAATVAALDRGGPGIYNIVDDDPAPVSEWLPEYARALGAKPPRRMPGWLARLLAGPIAGVANQARGASNAKAKRELGLELRHPSWRQGFRDRAGLRQG